MWTQRNFLLFLIHFPSNCNLFIVNFTLCFVLYKKLKFIQQTHEFSSGFGFFFSGKNSKKMSPTSECGAVNVSEWVKLKKDPMKCKFNLNKLSSCVWSVIYTHACFSLLVVGAWRALGRSLSQWRKRWSNGRLDKNLAVRSSWGFCNFDVFHSHRPSK